MSILNWWVNSLSNLASFYIVMTHISSVNFKLIHFLLWIKGSPENSNFHILKSSAENLQDSQCHFWKNSSVILQIWHHSPVSWKITPLYFFSSNIIYFVQKQPIKVQTFETFQCSSQNSSNSLCQFWNVSQFLFKFSSFFSVITYNSSVIF